MKTYLPPALTHPALLRQGVRHSFFGRKGGVSKGIYESLNCGLGSKDDKKKVLENRKRVAVALSGRVQTPLLTPFQTHSARCLAVEEAEPRHTFDADALATNVRGLILAIGTADCGPVLFCDGKNKVIAAAHAGWRGAYGGILEETIQVMEALGAERKHTRAVLGPTISQAAYEVDDSFYARFVGQDLQNEAYFANSHKSGRHQFDLPGYICSRLRKAGLAKVVWTGHCTYRLKEDYFSYRRASHAGHADYGRQLAAVYMAQG